MNGIAEYLWLVGLIIAGLLTVHALWLVADGFRRSAGTRRQQQREAELFQKRVELVRRQFEQQQAASWTGWRKFEVQRKCVEDGQSQVCSFYLVPHDGKPIIPHKPGQFLTFSVPVPGQPRPMVRCYSLSDCQRPDHYRVTIKRVPPPRDAKDAPPGLVSNYFHDRVREGDILDVRAPNGQFALEVSEVKPVVLIGAGVGVTPVLAMLNALCEAGDNREVWFFYGVRNRAEHIMAEHFEAIDNNHPNVHVNICYSHPTDDDRPGTDYHHGERISVDLLRRVLPSNNFDFYVCGPGPMMDAVTEGLTAWGVPDERVHTETFGPSAGTKKQKELTPDDDGPEIVFRKSGKKVHWSSKAGNLWEFAQACGVRIDSGCLEGSCRSCQTAIVEGDVDVAPGKEPVECENGSCLVCCCVPKGKVVLDA